jgi:hypothetical protein
VVRKIVSMRRWSSLSLKSKNLSAANAQPHQSLEALRTAKNTDQSSLTLSASSAAPWPSGSVGGLLISVMTATKDSAKEITLVNIS